MSHLQGKVPGYVNVVFIFIQPHLRHPQRIAFHRYAQVWKIRLSSPLNVGDFGARYDLYASPA